uniref:Uncharacterized protein n=1 Tax=Anguilla anguilla TaxID=7936 RepID=A0A0E9T4B0_ANGAN
MLVNYEYRPFLHALIEHQFNICNVKWLIPAGILALFIPHRRAMAATISGASSSISTGTTEV